MQETSRLQPCRRPSSARPSWHSPSVRCSSTPPSGSSSASGWGRPSAGFQRVHRMVERIHLAANNADLGGGEQMLVRTAEALIALGRPVTVVAPDSPSEVLDVAAATGASVVAIRAGD